MHTSTLCGICLEPLPSKYHKHCSRTCSAEALKRKARAARNELIQSRTYGECEECGIPLTNHQARFCGYSCSNRGSNNPMANKAWVETHPDFAHKARCAVVHLCPRCGGETPRKKTYCSKACKTAASIERGKSTFLAQLTTNSRMKSGAVRRRGIRYGVLEAKCVGCGLEEWTSSFGTSSPLQLDHINGVNTDNRLENLRILCANCHTQTDTFCGKNIKKKSKK